jgi:hypothetical protein
MQTVTNACKTACIRLHQVQTWFNHLAVALFADWASHAAAPLRLGDRRRPSFITAGVALAQQARILNQSL